MKKIHSVCQYGLVILMGLLLMACPNDVTPEGEKQKEGNHIKVNPGSSIFDVNREATIHVDATEGLSWDAKADQNWIEVSPVSGVGSTNITIKVKSDNPGTTDRTGKVTLIGTRYTDISANIDVTQKGTYLTCNKNEASFPTAGGQTTLTVTSNAEWNLKSKPEWITSSVPSGMPGSTNVTLSATSNPDDGERNGELTFATKEGAVTATIKVSQSPVTLTIDAQQVNINPEGGSAEVQVTANSSWSAASDAGWCRTSPTQGSGNATLSIVADSHSGSSERTATVTLRSSQVERTLTVVQSAATLRVADEELRFTPAKSNQAVVVESNTRWSATSSDESWCTIAPAEARGDGSVNINVEENTKAKPRDAKVTLKAGAILRSIVVKQEGVSLAVDKQNLEFASQSQAATIAVTSNTAWTAESSDNSWCKVSPAYGTASGDIRIDVETHTGTEDRKAVITIKAGEVTRQISVSQEAPYLRVTPNGDIRIGATGGLQTLTISSSVEWTVASNKPEWCSLSKQGGKGGDTVEVKVEANSVPEERQATITFSGGPQPVHVTVTQDAAAVVFDASPKTLRFDAAGGQKTVTLTANIGWSATTEQEWITIDPQSQNGSQAITVSAAQNTRNESREGSIVISGSKGSKSISISVTQDEAVVIPGGDDNTLPQYTRKKN